MIVPRAYFQHKYASKRYGFPCFVSIVDGQILHLRTVNSVPPIFPRGSGVHHEPILDDVHNDSLRRASVSSA